jgi:hypothetical protein
MSKDNYNYNRFKLSHYDDYGSFNGLDVGELAFDFTAYTLDGDMVKLSDFLEKPVVLETGSITCNVYTANVPQMLTLAEKFPQFNFLVLYIREAHPGEKIGPHTSMDEKMKRAKALEKEVGETRTVLVDSLDGEAHVVYGSEPDMIYVIGENSRILYREKWNHADKLRDVLEAIKKEKNVPEPEGFLQPGAVSVIGLFRGGFLSFWDFVKETPKIIQQNRNH